MKKSLKQVYIADSYAMNTGDLGILFATVQELKKHDVDLNIHIESSHPRFLSKFDELHDYPLYPRVFDIEQIINTSTSRLEKFFAVIKGVRDSVLFFMWSMLYRAQLPSYWILPNDRREQAKALANSDIVLSSGGGFLSSYYLYGFRLQIYSIAFLLKKPVVIFAQSVGPFNTFLSRRFVPYFLRRIELIIIREQDSYEYLKRLMPDLQTHLVNDIAFLLEKDSYLDKDFSLIFRKPTVAFCLKNNKNREYIDAIIDSANFIKSKNRNILFVSQTPAGDLICRKIASLVGCPNNVVEFGLSPRQVKAIYSKCDFIIANRMHAIVFAATETVPFICISYEPKFLGLLKNLNYPKELLVKSENINTLSRITKKIFNENKIIKKSLMKEAEIESRSIKSINLIFDLSEI